MEESNERHSNSESESESLTTNPGDYVICTYQRAAFKHYIRYFVVLTILMLDFASIMSFLERLNAQHPINPLHEFFFFAFVLFVNILFLLPVLFEVNRVLVYKSHIGLSTLFWRTSIEWSKVSSFERPIYLKYGILMTDKGFYLLNKRDLKPYDQLVTIITSNIADRPAIEENKPDA